MKVDSFVTYEDVVRTAQAFLIPKNRHANSACPTNYSAYQFSSDQPRLIQRSIRQEDIMNIEVGRTTILDV